MPPHQPLKENIKYYQKKLNHVYFIKLKNLMTSVLCMWWTESRVARAQNRVVLITELIPEGLNPEPPKLDYRYSVINVMTIIPAKPDLSA